jgi:large subunit ribosomal protein L9
MKVILLQDVERFGKAGEVKEVRDGYGFNFLLPRGLAEFATPEAVRQSEKLVAQRRRELQVLGESFAAQASELKDKKIVIKMKAKDGKLFGSVGREEIIKALSALNIRLDIKMIELEKSFKEIGNFSVTANFGNNIKSVFEVLVEPE